MSVRYSWAEISLRQLKENLRIIRDHIGPERKVMTVVKADAYGHGAVPVARALEDAGVDALAVAFVYEGIGLREGGVKAPILVLTGFFPGEEEEFLKWKLTPGIARVEQVEALGRAARAAGQKLTCHVKIDTGMGRMGVPVAEVPDLLTALATSPLLTVEGLYTHFAASEDFTSDQTHQQLEGFRAARARLAEKGWNPSLIHLANTGATLARPETWESMVRVGSLLYGFQSFLKFPEGRDRSEAFRRAVPVQPVMTLKSRVYQVRDFPAGSPIGYNGRFVTERASRIATLPLGYGDGWRRGLMERCRVRLRGRYAPMVGVIGMDLTAVDVTDVPGVEAGDEAVLLGSDGSATISPSEVARALGSVASEILTGIGKRVPRVYLDG